MTAPLGLLTVTHFFESHRGGIEIVAGRLVRELRSIGHRLGWAAADVDQAPVIAGVEALPLKSWNGIERVTGLPMPLPMPSATRKLFGAVRCADALIVHDGLYASSVAAMIAAKLAGKPVLLVQHIAEIPFANPVLVMLMRVANAVVTRPMLAVADQVVFISETTAQHFRTVRFKRPPLLAFNGVDTEVFAPTTAAEKAAARQNLGLPPDRRIATFVGRFVEKKGLAVIRALAEARPEMLFALAGRGPIDPAAWGLGNVRVFGGLEGPTLAGLYRSSDVFVLPSVGEGFPLVIQEALACGLPVLCSSESAAADPAATPLLHGLKVDLTRPAETAARFAEVFAEPIEADGMDRRAAFARSRYSWGSTARLYAQALAGILRPARSGSVHEQRA